MKNVEMPQDRKTFLDVSQDVYKARKGIQSGFLSTGGLPQVSKQLEK